VDSAQTDGPRDWEDRLAKPMFYLAAVFLVLLSGLIREGHHVNAGTPADLPWLYLGGLLLMWPVFLAEGTLRISLLPPTERSPKRIALTLGPSLLPPLRMAVRGVRRPDQLWLPELGWQVVDYDLSKTLELFFSVPMMFMALLILPVLAVEYYWHYWLAPMESEPLLRAFLDVCISVIWIAFTAEFIIRMAAAESRWQYALAHWLVALTGWAQAEDRRRSQETGFDRHFTKPVDFAALQTFLASLTLHGESKHAAKRFSHR
jgi:hypothetical protein